MIAALKRLGAPSWADQLDFTGPRARTSVWGWALLALGVAVAMATWDGVSQAEQAHEEATATLRRLSRGQHRLAMGQAPAQARSASPGDVAPALDSSGWQHAGQLAQWLAFPWPQVLDDTAMGAAHEQAVMTLFSLDLTSLASRADARPEVRLQAAVRDDAAALRWAAALGPGAQLRSRERLTTPFSGQGGSYEWRAEAVVPKGAP